jgi:hypothetical protein
MDQIAKNIVGIAVDFIKSGIYVFEINDTAGNNILTADGFLDTSYTNSDEDYFDHYVGIGMAWNQTCSNEGVWDEFEEKFCKHIPDENVQPILNPDAFKEPYEAKKATCVVDTDGNILGDVKIKSTYIVVDEHGEICYLPDGMYHNLTKEN